MFLGSGGECCKEDVGDQGSGQTSEHHEAATQLIEKCCSVYGTHHGEDWIDGVDEELFVLIRYACVLDHFGLPFISTGNLKIWEYGDVP